MTWITSPLFHQIRDLLEIVYFLSTVALAVVGAYGLQQIRILKEDIKIRNERAAKEQAISVAQRFIKCGEYSRAYREALTQENLDYYSGPVGDFSGNSLSQDATGAGVKKWKLAKLWLPALNELEAMAVSYVSGVADEQLGYTILGIGYCRAVLQHYDLISLYRGDSSPERNYWRNTIALYKIWSERAKKEGLLKKYGEIVEQLRSSPDQTINPIGVQGKAAN